ncbi:ABC transporter permease subunit [Salinispira pacifica]
MSNTLSILRKELRSYFNSPIAYIAVLFFLVFTSVWLFYIQQFFAHNVADLRPYFAIMPLVFIVLLPAITMRGWAEENKLGTVELLMTLPFREGEVVVGKFLGAFLLLVIMIALTIPVPLTVVRTGHFEIGQIVGQYIGLLFLGGAGIAIGLFLSSVSTNQITAFILSIVVLLFLTLVNRINASTEVSTGFAGFVNYLSLDYHFQSFIKGLIDTRDLIYYLLTIFVFLYMNTKVLVFRKWR